MRIHGLSIVLEVHFHTSKLIVGRGDENMSRVVLEEDVDAALKGFSRGGEVSFG